jgi:hypothetical protein
VTVSRGSQSPLNCSDLSHVAILQPPTAETHSLFLGGLNDPRVGGLNHLHGWRSGA